MLPPFAATQQIKEPRVVKENNKQANKQVANKIKCLAYLIDLFQKANLPVFIHNDRSYYKSLT